MVRNALTPDLFENEMRYVILGLLWSAWCFVHSVLISLTVTEYLKQRFQAWFRYYRLIYNGFALASLLPIAIYTYSVQTEPLFRWEAYLRLVQFLLVFISLFLFLSGSRHYDALQFLGIRESKQSNSCPVLTENCELDTTGVLGRYTPSLVCRGHSPCLGSGPGSFRNHNERNNHRLLHHWNVSGRTQTLHSVRPNIYGVSAKDIHVFSREVVEIKDEDERSHASLKAVSKSLDDSVCRKQIVFIAQCPGASSCVGGYSYQYKVR